MKTGRDDSSWTLLIPAAALVLCCAGPLLVAAAGAGILVAVASWLEASRASLLTTAALLAAVAIYTGRRGQATCCAPGEPRPPQRARRISIAAWTGAGLALVAAGLSWLISAR